MPMGIVSDSDYESEKTKLIKPTVIIPEVLNKEKGPNVPDSLRKIIGEESALNGRTSAVDLARQFGISPSSTSAYAHGSTSLATYDKQPNVAHVNGAKERIAIKARKKLNLALTHITDQKLSEAKVRDIAGIARDMSVIVKNMEPDIPQVEKNTGPTFVIYSPPVKSEDDYGIIKVKE